VPKIPFAAYKGGEPYIFVSYAHKDSDKVFPIITEFHDKGFPVWYDEGIDPGNEWPEEIAKALLKCSLFIVFISSTAGESVNVRREINYALSKNKNFIHISLEEAQLNPGLEMQISSNQGIMRYRMDDESFYRKCFQAFENFEINANQSVSTHSAPVPKPIAPAPQPAPRPEPVSAAKTGDTGPSGGIVLVVGSRFLICKSQILEVAPANTEFAANWNDAKSRCATLKVNGIGGWRLPTKNELNAMYTKLHKKGLGGFSSKRYYWSSSENDALVAWRRSFGNGGQDSYDKRNVYCVRAVRAF
jgi:hypothetical protein